MLVDFGGLEVQRTAARELELRNDGDVPATASFVLERVRADAGAPGASDGQGDENKGAGGSDGDGEGEGAAAAVPPLYGPLTQVHSSQLAFPLAGQSLTL